MRIEVTFEELLALLRNKVSQPITLQYVAPDTVAVNTTVKVKIFQKDVTLNLRIIRIDGNDVLLSYDGGVGIDLILSLLLHLMDENEKYGVLYEKFPNNQIIIHLDKIPQLQSVLDKIIILNLRFTENSAIINFSLK